MNPPQTRKSNWLLALLLCGLMCFAAACARSNKELVGKWKTAEDTDLTEFRQDGTFILAGDEELKGTYKVLSGDRVKLTLDGPIGKAVGSLTFTMVLRGDTLEVTDPDGEKQTFQRVK